MKSLAEALNIELNEAHNNYKYYVIRGSFQQNSGSFYNVQMLKGTDDLVEALDLVDKNFANTRGTKVKFSNDQGFYYIENTVPGPQFGFCMVMFAEAAKNYKYVDSDGKVRSITGM